MHVPERDKSKAEIWSGSHLFPVGVKLCVLAYFIVRYVEVKTGQSWERIARFVSPVPCGGTDLRQQDQFSAVQSYSRNTKLSLTTLLDFFA